MGAGENWVNAGHSPAIIWMPMKDAATAHINEGTGGNFTLNGTIATSERGANQDNCVASYFDGTADYLSRNISIPNETKLQVCFNFKVGGGDSRWLYIGDSLVDLQPSIVFNIASSYVQYSQRADASLPTYVKYTYPFVNSRTYHMLWEIDISNPANSKLFIDGKKVTLSITYGTHNISNVSVLGGIMVMGAYNGGSVVYAGGTMGELYLNFLTSSDIETNNPFWDKDTNKPVPVRKVIANTGVTPLIAMPLDASNAGKNYGTGGDFVANSSPYIGSRGASEFWARSAKFDGTTGYLSRGALTGIINSKQLTIVANIYKASSVLYGIVYSASQHVSMYIGADNKLYIECYNGSGALILKANTTTLISNNVWTSILVSIDLSSTATRSIYLNGVVASATWTTYNTLETFIYSGDAFYVGQNHVGTDRFNGSMNLMLDNTYIDFTNEANRLKYIDGLGYPLSINEQVTKGVITKPALYLAFEDITNIGLNSGYGGNFTVNGTVTQGADVNG